MTSSPLSVSLSLALTCLLSLFFILIFSPGLVILCMFPLASMLTNTEGGGKRKIKRTTKKRMLFRVYLVLLKGSTLVLSTTRWVVVHVLDAV